MARESDKEPGPLALAVTGIRLVGVRDALRTVTYGLRKARLDRRYLAGRPDGPEVRPGERGAPQHDGRVTTVAFGEVALEVAFVADGIVRLTWTPGRLPVPVALDGTPELVAHTVDDDGVDLVLTADGVRVRLGADGATTVEVAEADGWAPVRTEQPPTRTAERWRATVDLAADDRVHGTGERSARFDLRPGTYGLWNTEQSGSYGPDADPLYLTVPVAFVVGPGRSHLTFWENSHKGEVVVGDDLRVTFDGGALRSWICTGPPDVALRRYHGLTGRSPLPPRWALGYHQCRWGYRTEADIRDVVAGFVEHALPLSAVHLDIDYMDRYRVFTVDTVDFPDLTGMIADLAGDDVATVVILDPGVAKDEAFPLYREGRDRGHYLTLPDGSEANGIVWPGVVAFPDFSDPEVREWWAAQYPALLDQGVAGIWHDMCEPAVFAVGPDASLPLATRHDLEGQGGDHVEGRNLYGLGMAQAGHAAMLARGGDRRPWIVTRSGWAGVQRHAWTWTGDVATSWTMLHRTLCTALNLSLSGIPYTGPDIGGFSGDPSPELYTRWFQLAAWLPFFRSHSIFTMPSREPWRAAGPHLDVVREAARLRYRLLPYLYTQAWVHTERAQPFTAPVWWPASEDPELLAVDDQFLVGADVLVAPVFELGASERTVRLPAGSWWALGTGTVHAGTVTVPVDLDAIPVFVRAGAVLPTDEHGRDVLWLHPPVDGEPVSSWWYRDAGDGDGPYRVDTFTVSGTVEEWRVVRRADERSEAYAATDEDLAVRIDGEGWTVAVDGGEPVAVVPGEPLLVGDAAELVVRRPA